MYVNFIFCSILFDRFQDFWAGYVEKRYDSFVIFFVYVQFIYVYLSHYRSLHYENAICHDVILIVCHPYCNCPWTSMTAHSSFTVNSHAADLALAFNNWECTEVTGWVGLTDCICKWRGLQWQHIPLCIFLWKTLYQSFIAFLWTRIKLI